MMYKMVLMIFTIIIVMIFYSCEKSTNDLVTAPQSKNLLTNSSFEINGSPTMNGWTLSEDDTTFLRYLLRFSSDVPPGGGKSSIVVNYSFPGPWRIYQLVPANAGSHIYRLSFWARNFFGQGKVTLGLKTTMDTVINLQTVRPVDSLWTFHNMFDTVTADVNDSLVVIINSGYVGVTRLGGGTWFDVVRLEGLN
jgi:hypothetical protein